MGYIFKSKEDWIKWVKDHLKLNIEEEQLEKAWGQGTYLEQRAAMMSAFDVWVVEDWIKVFGCFQSVDDAVEFAQTRTGEELNEQSIGFFKEWSNSAVDEREFTFRIVSQIVQYERQKAVRDGSIGKIMADVRERVQEDLYA